MASVKSRSRGVITWRDALTRLRTHQLPPGCRSCESPVNTQPSRGGVLLRSGGRLRREVIVGCDRGGRCQASFRICSLRSSCCIFYRRNKRTACYFHTRAISLRAAAKETRGGRGAETNLFFQKHKEAPHAGGCGSFSPHHVFGVKSRWISQKDQQEGCLQTHPPDKSMANIHFISRKPSSA